MIVVPYLIGVVTAPLVVAVAKPIVRGTVKATMAVGLQAKKAAAEAREDLHVITSEARGDEVQRRADEARRRADEAERLSEARMSQPGSVAPPRP